MNAIRPRSIVARMVERAGGQSALARHFGIKQQSVRDWLEADRVPPERVLACERLTGVPRWQLRPDLYPPSEYHGSDPTPP